MQETRKSPKGYLDRTHWIGRISDPNYRAALLDALAEIQHVPQERIADVYVALLLDVFGPWREDNRDRFRPYAISVGRGRSLANERRFSTIVVDEIPESYAPFRRLIEKYTPTVAWAALIVYEIDAADGSLTTILKAHVRLLKAGADRVANELPMRIASALVKRFAPALREARAIAAGRRLGGQKTAQLLQRKNLERNIQICREARRYATTKAKNAIPSLLAKRYLLTARQIRSILKNCTKEETS